MRYSWSTENKQVTIVPPVPTRRTSSDPDHSDTVIHQVKTHTVISRNQVSDPAAVSLNSEGTLMLDGGQSNDDLAGMTVLDRVVHRLLRNIIEVRGRRVIMD